MSKEIVRLAMNLARVCVPLDFGIAIFNIVVLNNLLMGAGYIVMACVMQALYILNRKALAKLEETDNEDSN